MMQVLVTGSNGLIGNSVVNFYLQKGAKVVGVDNNLRRKFFGQEASTAPNLINNPHYQHLQQDVRNTKQLTETFQNYQFDLIVHTAAQPSHDKAKDIPFIDFDVNARATLGLLELTRQWQSQAVFVFTSTNKVYGDRPNQLPLKETDARYVYANNIKGIDENMSIDHSTHSLFGASKLAADIYVQEYGRYFQLKTTCLRLGCVTGSAHASTKLHGFLSYLIKSLVHDGQYEIVGYRGKQVRDQIHADDVVTAIDAIYKNPQPGAVFNLGGGIYNNASILELIDIIEKKLHIKAKISYQDKARIGDHICYITNLDKFMNTYPQWKISKNLDQIINEIINHEQASAHQHSR